MTWSVDLSPAAVRQLRALPPSVAPAVVEFVTATLAENPHRLTKPLTGAFEALRSARRGDYRVLVELDDEAQSVLVVRIAHRSAAYRPPAP